jgi:hypothetical protein
MAFGVRRRGPRLGDPRFISATARRSLPSAISSTAAISELGVDLLGNVG